MIALARRYALESGKSEQFREEIARHFSASLGLIGSVSFLILAVRCFSQVQWLKGVAGPFSGLGHAIYGYVAVIGALFL